MSSDWWLLAPVVPGVLGVCDRSHLHVSSSNLWYYFKKPKGNCTFYPRPGCKAAQNQSCKALVAFPLDSEKSKTPVVAYRVLTAPALFPSPITSHCSWPCDDTPACLPNTPNRFPPQDLCTCYSSGLNTLPLELQGALCSKVASPERFFSDPPIYLLTHPLNYSLVCF